MTVAALSISALAYIYAQRALIDEGEYHRGTQDVVDSSFSSARIAELPTDRELFAALSRIYDSLLGTQVELPNDAKAILYDKRWDLYE